MADPSPAPARPLDPVAVERALAEAARRPEPPWLHREVARRMAERLALIRSKPERIVDWWGFLGAGVDVLEAAYPKAQRVIVEPTEALRSRSRSDRADPWWSARRWTRAPSAVLLESADVPAGAQLVFANMMLHGASDPPALIARWLGLLAIDGFVMFSCLGPGTLTELRALYRALGWGSPAAAFVDMHDLGDMMVHAGFADPVMDQETLTIEWDDPATLLRDLRLVGRNAEPQRAAGLRTPRWRERLLAALQGLRRADGRIALSFEVAYGHAFKAAPRVRAGEPVAISLDDMRAMTRAPRRRSPPR